MKLQLLNFLSLGICMTVRLPFNWCGTVEMHSTVTAPFFNATGSLDSVLLAISVLYDPQCRLLLAEASVLLETKAEGKNSQRWIRESRD